MAAVSQNGVLRLKISKNVRIVSGLRWFQYFLLVHHESQMDAFKISYKIQDDGNFQIGVFVQNISKNVKIVSCLVLFQYVFRRRIWISVLNKRYCFFMCMYKKIIQKHAENRYKSVRIFLYLFKSSCFTVVDGDIWVPIRQANREKKTDGFLCLASRQTGSIKTKWLDAILLMSDRHKLGIQPKRWIM